MRAALRLAIATRLRQIADRLNPPAATEPDGGSISVLWLAIQELHARVDKECAGMHEAGQLVQLEQGAVALAARVAALEQRLSSGAAGAS